MEDHAPVDPGLEDLNLAELFRVRERVAIQDEEGGRTVDRERRVDEGAHNLRHRNRLLTAAVDCERHPAPGVVARDGAVRPGPPRQTLLAEVTVRIDPRHDVGREPIGVICEVAEETGLGADLDPDVRPLEPRDVLDELRVHGLEVLKGEGTPRGFAIQTLHHRAEGGGGRLARCAADAVDRELVDPPLAREEHVIDVPALVEQELAALSVAVPVVPTHAGQPVPERAVGELLEPAELKVPNTGRGGAEERVFPQHPRLHREVAGQDHESAPVDVLQGVQEREAHDAHVRDSREADPPHDNLPLQERGLEGPVVQLHPRHREHHVLLVDDPVVVGADGFARELGHDLLREGAGDQRAVEALVEDDRLAALHDAIEPALRQQAGGQQPGVPPGRDDPTGRLLRKLGLDPRRGLGQSLHPAEHHGVREEREQPVGVAVVETGHDDRAGRELEDIRGRHRATLRPDSQDPAVDRIDRQSLDSCVEPTAVGHAVDATIQKHPRRHRFSPVEKSVSLALTYSKRKHRNLAENGVFVNLVNFVLLHLNTKQICHQCHCVKLESIQNLPGYILGVVIYVL